MGEPIDLLVACEAGLVEKVKSCLAAGQDSSGVPDENLENWDGRTPLMAAAEHGHLPVVQLLLEHGAPWNAMDRAGRCAGDFAVQGGHQEVVDLLVQFGCEAELVLGLLERQKLREQSEAGNSEYLQQKLTFHEDKILDEAGDAVMMEWEKPLMEAHAELICSQGGDVLNVGFGMGLIDEAIQARFATNDTLRSHTIIEAHPDVYARMLKDGWDKRKGVRILFGRWQDMLGELKQYDGIFFDTYGEHYYDLSDFQSYLPQILKKDGVYSFFNGLAPDNMFFHGVSCEVVKLELQRLGMVTQFKPIAVQATQDATWKGTSRRYFHNNMYYVPFAYFDDEEADE
mmetsp:Transcript_20248/g.56139  ORF Transcript_20248/g.56139 Transcript_20248/m.56139 type:complete len:342 (-) Transcript_20248:150-1175(-)